MLIHHQKLKDKSCIVCGAAFSPRSGVNKFCSTNCKDKHNQTVGSMAVSKQYERISGNWRAYLTRLVTQKRKEDGLTVDALMLLLEEQEYKCALTGIKMTCSLEQGKIFKTNVSIDRIEAGGPYVIENIQLVCRAVNSFRNDVDVSEFVWWCKQVANHNKEN